MKVVYSTRNGRLSVELSGDDQKTVFAEIARFQEVLKNLSAENAVVIT